MCDSPVFDLQGFEAPVSLWGLVEKQVPDHEREEVKDMLGESLVEQSKELHEELEALLAIWRDYRDETSHSLTSSRLPEPPDMRDRLKQEIRFFVDSIREKAKEEGRNADRVLSRHNSEVIDYALETKRPSSGGQLSRPPTALSHEGRETPLLRNTPSSDRGSGVSTLSDEVDSMNEKLNVLKLDEVIQHLRQTMEEEVEQIMSDIKFLQSCLEEEVDYRDQSSISREPTLADLRTERSALEKDLLKNKTSLPNSPARVLPRKLPSPITPGSPKVRSLPASPKAPPVSQRSGPLKASHEIGGRKLKYPEHKITGLNSKSSSPKSAKLEGQGGKLDSTSPKVKLRHNAQLVGVASINQSEVSNAGLSSRPTPSPPSSAKPERPGSASRFRKMVLECRDS